MGLHLKHSDFTKVSDALRELYAHTDAPSLPHCMVRLMRLLVPSDSAAYNHVDYQAHHLEVVHDHGEEADQVMPALNAHIDQHPVLKYWQRTGTGGAAKISDFLTRRQFRDTAIYQEFFGTLGLNDQIGFYVEERGRVAITMSLQRSGPNFTERDRSILAFLQPHFVQAYKNASDLTALKNRATGMESIANLCDVAAVWLSHDDRIEWMSSRAEIWLREYFPETTFGSKSASSPLRLRLPTALAAWIQKQKVAQESNNGLGWRAEQTIFNPRGELNVRWISEAPNRSYLILSERQKNQGPEQLRSLGLTDREAEVLHWIAEGKTNEVIAILLRISKRTVEKHIERILTKLGLETRVQAALWATAWRKP